MTHRAPSHFPSLVLAVCLAAPALAQSADPAVDPARNEHVQSVRARYDYASWPQGARRAGLPLAVDVEGWSAGPLHSEGGRLARAYGRAEGDSRPAFLVESFVAESVDAAHAELLLWLAGVQSAAAVPEARELGLEVGDRGYVGRSGAGARAISWIAFVRGNVAVRVSALDPRRLPELDLGAVARAVDLSILARPTLAAGAALPRPEIPMLVAQRTSLVAGEEVRLDATVIDPDGGEPHLRWTVEGEGRGYVEREPDGSFRLHTTGAGAMKLVLEVTGSSGTWARRSIDLAIAED